MHVGKDGMTDMLREQLHATYMWEYMKFDGYYYYCMNEYIIEIN